MSEQLKIEAISNQLLDINTKNKALEAERDRLLKEMESGQNYLEQTRSHLKQIYQMLEESLPQENLQPKLSRAFQFNKKRSLSKSIKRKDNGEVHLKIQFFKPPNENTEGMLKIDGKF